MDSQQLVRSWLNGRARLGDDGGLTFADSPAPRRSEKLRRAYDWIATRALVTPYHDMEFGATAAVGRDACRVELPGSVGYASFVLMPLLNLLTNRRLVFVGGPGRGKTTMATLMALLAGAPLAEVRRAVQHGHPQLTLADLLGSPLPGDLVRAEDAADVTVRWRRWVTARVKVIDEYNRIPTKTQSALLSLMAEGYAEQYEQTVECGASAWFLTANDDQGGGTFPVIEALRDRIDGVVRCPPLHPGLMRVLAERVAAGSAPEEFVPGDLVWDNRELDAAAREVQEVAVPAAVRDLLGLFLGQFDFCRRASDRLEYQTKDTLHLAGRRVGHVCTEDCPLDKSINLCTQTESGVSPRAGQALLHFAQAIAYFRGRSEVGVEHARAVLPWVLHDKLPLNPQSPFFQKPENRVYLTDRVSWLWQLFDKAVDLPQVPPPPRPPQGGGDRRSGTSRPGGDRRGGPVVARARARHGTPARSQGAACRRADGPHVRGRHPRPAQLPVEQAGTAGGAGGVRRPRRRRPARGPRCWKPATRSARRRCWRGRNGTRTRTRPAATWRPTAGSSGRSTRSANCR